MSGSKSTPNIPPAPQPGEFVFPLPGTRPGWGINNGPKGVAAKVVLQPKTDLSRYRKADQPNLGENVIEVPPQIWRQRCRHEHEIDGANVCSCAKYEPSLWLPSSLFNDLTFVLDAKPCAQELLNQAAVPGCQSSDFYVHIRPRTSNVLGQGRFVSYKMRDSVRPQLAERMHFSKMPRPEKIEYDVNCVLLPLLLRFSEEYYAVKKAFRPEGPQTLAKLQSLLGGKQKPEQPSRPKILCSCGHGSVWHAEREEVPLMIDPEDTVCLKCKGSTTSLGATMRSDEGEASEEEVFQAFQERRKERHAKASCTISKGRLIMPEKMMRSTGFSTTSTSSGVPASIPASSNGFAATSLGFNPKPHVYDSRTGDLGFRSRASAFVDEPQDQSPPVLQRPAAVRKSVRGSICAESTK